MTDDEGTYTIATPNGFFIGVVIATIAGKDVEIYRRPAEYNAFMQKYYTGKNYLYLQADTGYYHLLDADSPCAYIMNTYTPSTE